MSAKQTKSELFCKFVKTHVLQPVGLASDEFGEQAQAALDSAQDILTRPGRLHANAPLADLKPGECGTIERLLGSSEGRLRLLEMGMTPGTHVKVIRAAAFGGPLDVLVRGYQLSLRREEAAQIWLGAD